jgi:hypothetical protein
MVTIKKEPKNKGLGPVTSCCLSVSILWIVVSFVMIFLDDNGSYLLDVQHESFDTKVHPPLIGSFSAYVFVRDENHRLPKWIAYHYHTFGLEYLVIGTKESSKSSPKLVLKCWLEKIRIDVWD